MKKSKILFVSLVCILSLFFSLILITGCSNGEQFEFELSNNTYTITKYNEINSSDTTTIVIPDEYNNLPVTAIGFNAFASSNMMEVTLGENIKEIKFRAFMDCKNLRTINFNDQLIDINFSAFTNCSSLMEVSLPSSLEVIGNSVFDNCHSLERIRVNSDIDNIFNAITSKNYSLLALHLNASTPPTLDINILDNINPYLRIYVPEEHLEAYHSYDNWKTISDIVFADKQENYYIQDEDGVWYNNEEKTILLNAPQTLPREYTICDSVIEIGSYAFYKSNLTIITMGSNVETIGKEAFAENLALNSVEFNDKLKNIDEKAFYSIWGITNITFPESLECIKEYAFGSCVFLKNISIPSSVQFIEKTAFFDTPWLNSLDDEFVIVGDGILIKYNGNSSSITIPENVRVLAWEVNNSIRKNVISINLSNIEIIAQETLYFPNLETIIFPENLQDIDYNNFDYQPWIKDMNEEYITINNDILIRVREQNELIEIPDGIRLIMNTNLSSNTQKAVLSNSVEIIGKNAFADSRLQEITLGENIQEIRADAFSRCVSLQSVIILSPIPPTIMDKNLRNTNIYVSEENLDQYREFYGSKYNILSLASHPDNQ